jgi:sugar lactone lactonase YvrE
MTRVRTAVLMAVVAALAVASRAADHRLVEFAESDRQWTGVAVSSAGRVFVSYPRWSPFVTASVEELFEDGRVGPFPNEEWNAWAPDAEAAGVFVCVQSVHVDAADRLWILDAGSPFLQGVVPGGAKLVQVDLERDEIARTYAFDEETAPEASYLNDVRVDTATGTAFITDSGLGAIVVLDLESGATRRVLEDHASTKAESTSVQIGEAVVPFVVHADGIALDAEGGWLYYQALTGRTLYRVPTRALLDDALSDAELAESVEEYARSGVSDGLLFGPGGVYLSALEDGAIRRVAPDRTVETLAVDDRIVWPDSFALGPDGAVWFTTSQIHLGAAPPTPYRVLKLVSAGIED